jgi:hypothetical protein
MTQTVLADLTFAVCHIRFFEREPMPLRQVNRTLKGLDDLIWASQVVAQLEEGSGDLTPASLAGTADAVADRTVVRRITLHSPLDVYLLVAEVVSPASDLLV